MVANDHAGGVDMSFLITVFAQLSDPLTLVGYVLAGVLVRNAGVALGLGFGWAVLMNMFVANYAASVQADIPAISYFARIVGGIMVTWLLFFASSFFRKNQKKHRKQVAAIPTDEGMALNEAVGDLTANNRLLKEANIKTPHDGFTIRWEDGVAAEKRGDYATALKNWRPLAEQGNALALQPRPHVQQRPRRHAGRCRGGELVSAGRRSGACGWTVQSRLFARHGQRRPRRVIDKHDAEEARA